MSRTSLSTLALATVLAASLAPLPAQDEPAAAPAAPAVEITQELVVSEVKLSEQELKFVEELRLDAGEIAALEAKPLYQFKEDEVGKYLAYMQKKVPALPKRIVTLGRKNIGQPYELYLLGEFPFETYDPQPLYCLEKSDCVVFSEHSYAMALTKDWPGFFAMLQRIRYKDGVIGVASRNHYTESDWDKNNTWLVKDISQELAGDRAVAFHQKVDRAKFLKNRYKIDRNIPVEEFSDVFVPVDMIPEIEKQLRDGDYVNVMVGPSPDKAWATHVGLIAIADDGTVDFLHSTPPRVREQPLAEYISNRREKEASQEAGKPILFGFKFLRLEDDPIANLRRLDGDAAPKVSAPAEARLAAGN